MKSKIVILILGILLVPTLSVARPEHTTPLTKNIVSYAKSGSCSSIASHMALDQHSLELADYSNPEHKEKIDAVCEKIQTAIPNGYKLIHSEVRRNGGQRRYTVYLQSDQKKIRFSYVKKGRHYILVDVN